MERKNGEKPDAYSTTEEVDHPPHYGGADNPYETIKVIEAWNLPVRGRKGTLSRTCEKPHGTWTGKSVEGSAMRRV
jgi:hypothetical protein